VKYGKIFAIALPLCLGLTTYGTLAMPIDFESFTDSSPLTNEVSGFTFSGGTVLTAGVSLNEFDYPPSSGENVLAAFLGSLTVSADTPFDQFSASFTFEEVLNFSGFDDLGNLLFSFDSPVASNLGSHTVIGHIASGITSLVVASQSGTPFTMDDLDISAASIPEPGTLGLLTLGGLAAARVRRRRA
jgi:hypothetical protein